MVIEQGLMELTTSGYRDWFREYEIRVTIYGNWVKELYQRDYSWVIEALTGLIEETANYTKRKMIFGVFADEGLDRISTLAKGVNKGEMLLVTYYGQPVGQVDLIIGSGQPVIWDLPLLDLNKAGLYFLQAPTFCLDQIGLRRILDDRLYQRVNDDDLYQDMLDQVWQDYSVLGLGQQTRIGWQAL
jgi:hypothetical protein